MLEEDWIDIVAVGFGLMALIFAYANLRKNGDGFVAAVSIIAAIVAIGWAFWN